MKITKPKVTNGAYQKGFADGHKEGYTQGRKDAHEEQHGEILICAECEAGELDLIVNDISEEKIFIGWVSQVGRYLCRECVGFLALQESEESGDIMVFDFVQMEEMAHGE